MLMRILLHQLQRCKLQLNASLTPLHSKTILHFITSTFLVETDGTIFFKYIAAVSCIYVVYRLGGAGLVSGVMGKVGRAWHRCMGGAWVHGDFGVGDFGVGINRQSPVKLPDIKNIIVVTLTFL